MPTVLLYENVPDAWFDGFAEFLRENQPDGLELELAQPKDNEADSVLSLIPEADVLVVGLTGQRRAVDRHVLEDAVRLKLVQKLGSRTHSIDLDAAREAGVPVSLLPAPAHVACAEHTVLLILVLAKKLLSAHQHVVRGRYRRTGREPRPTTASDYAYNWADLEGIGLVAGRVLGIIGMADIGIEVARRAKALGMEVIYHDPDALSEEEENELGMGRRELDDLLKEADVVSLHVARTPQTENLLDAQRLALMKPSAILINAARGGLVDEAALASALGEGKLAGAGIDAWSSEPTPRENPLLKLDNVVATPHVAAGTLPPAATFEAILPNIIAALRGDPIVGLVTPTAAEQPPSEDETEREEQPAKEEEPTEEEKPSAEEGTPAQEHPTSQEEPPAEEPPDAEEQATNQESSNEKD